MKSPLVDRRKAVRVRGEFLLELNSGRKVRVGKSVDLSAAGMCYEIDRPLPLFEEIEVRFQLPEAGPGEKTGWVSCRGVVVRCEKEPGRRKWRAAFYFSQCDLAARRRIAEYVKKAAALPSAA